MTSAYRNGLRSLLLVPLVWAQALLAQDAVQISWYPNPEPDITRYSVYYGESSGGQMSIVTVTNGTTAIVSGLLEGHSYVFYVTAWNNAELESDPSDPVTFCVNAWPDLLPIPDQQVQVGSLFTFAPIGSRLPPGETLSFALLPGAPASASLDPASGVFTWTPSADFAGSTNGIGIQVIDNWMPPRSGSASFNVIVEAPDSDGDGIPDWAELEAGTNPYDRTSLLQITSVADSGLDVAIEFSAVPGMSYRVESADVSPAGLSWHVLANNVVATGSRETVIDPGGHLVSTRFYRVGLASSPVPVLSAPYGFTTLRVAGTHGAASAISFLGVPLTRPVVYYGTIDSIDHRRILDSNANWIDGAFEGSNGPYYVEITSGRNAGLTADIVTTECVTKSLVLSRDVTGLGAGVTTYVIRPHWTLASIFGPRDESGLGTLVDGSADEIGLLDPSSQVWSFYRYQVVGLGGIGWRSSVDLASDQSNIKIAPGQGLAIRRHRREDLIFKVCGTFKTSVTVSEIHTGINLIANPVLADITLGGSGLYTGDPATGLAGGSKVSADQILVYKDGESQAFYYQTSGPGGSGWRSNANATSHESGTIIPANSSFVVLRRPGPGFAWLLQSGL